MMREGVAVSRDEQLRRLGLTMAGAVHDLNNLLAAVVAGADGMVEALDAQHPLFEEATEVAHAGRLAVELSRRMLRQLRAVAAESQPVDANRLVGELAPLLRRLVPDRDLVPDLDPGLGEVAIEAGQLERILINLTLNARDATGPGGVLRIRTRYLAAEREAVIAFSDDGRGMSEDVARRAFQPMFTTKGGGSGLGLTTVRILVEDAGGRVDLDTCPGAGTTVVIRLPALPTPWLRPAEQR